MRKPLYTRICPTKHGQLLEYARRTGQSVSSIIEMMVDQLLFQSTPGFRPPPWLMNALEDGLLDIARCDESEEK